MQANKSRRAAGRRRLGKLILIVAGFGLGLLFAETGLRLVGYSYPEFYQADARRGYSLRPGMEGWYRKEGEAYVRINNDGLRDRDHPVPKPANTVRIAVLGDSFIEALQLPFEQSFCAVLEKELNSCAAFSGRKVEVMNFGVSGYGTGLELLTLRHHVWAYAPDIVLLAVATSNDISDNVRELKKTDQIPYFVVRNGQLVEDDSFRGTRSFRSRHSLVGKLGRWFRDHLRIVQAVQQAAFTFRVRREEQRARAEAQQRSQSPAASGPPRLGDLGVDNLIYREPADPLWLNAWTVTEQLIRTMRDEVAQQGARFMVLTLSNPPQVVPSVSARDDFLRMVGARDIFYPDRRIKDFCEREGIPSANLALSMQKYADENHVMLHGFGAGLGNGHWNQNGHRLAAQLAAAEVCRLFQN